MKNICDWNNCFEIGEYKAPIEKDNSRNYRLLCLNHVKEFNKNWNYFAGMDDKQVYNFLKSDLTWHKPTQSFSSSFSFKNNLLSKTDFELIKNHLIKFKLLIKLKKIFQNKNIKNIVSFMKKDKKNNNKKINLVLLKKIGKPIFSLNFENKKLYSFLKKELND